MSTGLRAPTLPHSTSKGFSLKRLFGKKKDSIDVSLEDPSLEDASSLPPPEPLNPIDSDNSSLNEDFSLPAEDLISDGGTVDSVDSFDSVVPAGSDDSFDSVVPAGSDDSFAKEPSESSFVKDDNSDSLVGNSSDNSVMTHDSDFSQDSTENKTDEKSSVDVSKKNSFWVNESPVEYSFKPGTIFTQEVVETPLTDDLFRKLDEHINSEDNSDSLDDSDVNVDAILRNNQPPSKEPAIERAIEVQSESEIESELDSELTKTPVVSDPAVPVDDSSVNSSDAPVADDSLLVDDVDSDIVDSSVDLIEDEGESVSQSVESKSEPVIEETTDFTSEIVEPTSVDESFVDAQKDTADVKNNSDMQDVVTVEPDSLSGEVAEVDEPISDVDSDFDDIPLPLPPKAQQELVESDGIKSDDSISETNSDLELSPLPSLSLNQDTNSPTKVTKNNSAKNNSPTDVSTSNNDSVTNHTPTLSKQDDFTIPTDSIHSDGGVKTEAQPSSELDSLVPLDDVFSLDSLGSFDSINSSTGDNSSPILSIDPLSISEPDLTSKNKPGATDSDSTSTNSFDDAASHSVASNASSSEPVFDFSSTNNSTSSSDSNSSVSLEIDKPSKPESEVVAPLAEYIPFQINKFDDLVIDCERYLESSEIPKAKHSFNQLRELFLTASFSDQLKTRYHDIIKKLYDRIVLIELETKARDRLAGRR